LAKTKLQHIYLAIISLALLTFIGILNETSMNVTYPELSKTFGVSLDTVQWVTTGYLLMATITMGTTAYLLKQFPARRLQLVAVSAFIIGDLLGALSLNFPMLLIGRLVQAVATGLSTPILFHLIFTEIPRERLGSMTGFAGMVISFAPALGPTYGGWISEASSWRMIFWLLIPFALVSLLLGQLFIRNQPLGNTKRFSYASLLTLSLALFSIVYGLSTIGKHGLGWPIVGWLVLFVVFFALFIYINNHGQSQLFDLRVFKVHPLRLSTLTYFNLQFINIGVSLVIPLYAEYVLNTSATVAGLILLPGSVIGAFIAPLAGRLADSQGFAKPVTTGGSILLIGIAGFVFFQRQLTPILIMTFFILMRIGFNFSFSNTISNATTLVDSKNSADVNSIFNMLQQFAGSLGTVFLSAVMALFQNNGTGTLAARSYRGGRFDYLFLFAMAIIALTAIVNNYRIQKRMKIRATN
jgi:EmrB/QacA subfamily drug resistance transporter